MKKTLATILILLLLFPLFASDAKNPVYGYTYEEYKEGEFPIWQVELRRAESIFFGSFVFTIPVSALAFSTMANFGVVPYLDTSSSALRTLGAAAGTSLFIATLDWVLGRLGW